MASISRFLGSCALLILACQPARDPAQLVVAVDAPVRDLDPRLAVDGPSARLSRLIFQGLTQVDEHGAPALDLATELTQAGDALHYHATLRPGVRFHDGHAVTAADVAFTYQTVLDPAFGTPITGEFRKRFASVTADPRDPLVVYFVLRRPVATLWTDLVLGIAPAHLLRDQPNRRFAGPPVGSGPWRVVGAAAGERVTVQRVVPGAWPQQLQFVAIGDEGARALSVLGGGADVAWAGLSPAMVQGAAQTGRATLHSAPGIAFTYLGCNLRTPPLHQLAVRRALALALDRPALVQTVLGGLAVPADQMFAPGHWAHLGLPPLPFDPARAAQLLDEAGLRPGPDGVRLRLELKVSTSRMRRQVARALAEQWRKVGIDVAVRPFELATFLADVRAGRFELFLLQLPEPFEPDQLGWMLHTGNAAVKAPDLNSASPYARLDRRGIVPTAWDPALAADPACAQWQRGVIDDGNAAFALAPLGLGSSPGSANRTGYSNAWVDCWLDRGAAALQRPLRRQLYQQVQRQVAEDLPIIPLWWEHQVALVGPEVRLPQLPADGRYAALGLATRVAP